MLVVGALIALLFSGCQSDHHDTLPESHLEELQSKLLLTRAEISVAEVAHMRTLGFGPRKTKATEQAALDAAQKAERHCVNLGPFTECRDREEIEEIVHELAQKVRHAPASQ